MAAARKAGASKPKRGKSAKKQPSVPPKRRPTTRPPPPAWTSRAARAPWPESWLPENHDVALAQDVMLMAYWIADQLGDGELGDLRRNALTATLRAVAPALRAGADGLVQFTVAAAVRRNGALLEEALGYERARVESGGILEALLQAHEDEAVHACLREIGEHSPEIAAWLGELERRGRPELRNALREPGRSGPALERLLTVVQLATTRRSIPPSSRGAT